MDTAAAGEAWRIVLPAGLLVLVALGGGATVLGRANLPRPIRHLGRTGVGFLFLGVVLGPMGAGWLDHALRTSLEPAIVVSLGWIGFLYGTHLEWSRLRRFPLARYALAAAEGTGGAVAAALVAGAVLAWGGHGADGAGAVVAAAVFCGAASAGTSPASLFLLREEVRASGPLYERLLFLAALDDLPGLLLIAVCFVALRPAGVPAGAPMLWLAVTLGLGLSCAALLMLALRDGLEEERLVLVVLAAVGVGAGLAGVLHCAPLAVGLVAGVVVANVSPHKERVYDALAHRERTLYTLFLVLAGSLVDAPPGRGGWVIGLALALVVARLVGKMAGAALPALAGARETLAPREALALLPQGGIPLAMAASFAHAYPGPIAQVAVAAVVVAVVVSDLLGMSVSALALRGRP